MKTDDDGYKAFIHFPGAYVTYRTFVDDLAARIAYIMRSDATDPEFVSQRQAYRLFGRSSVARWRREGRVTPVRRPGKLEYRTATLRMLQRTEAAMQDKRMQ